MHILDQSQRAPFLSMMHGAEPRTEDWKLASQLTARLASGDLSALDDAELYPRLATPCSDFEVPANWPSPWNAAFAVAATVRFSRSKRFVLLNLFPLVPPARRSPRGLWGVWHCETGRLLHACGSNELLEAQWRDETTLVSLRWSAPDQAPGYVLELRSFPSGEVTQAALVSDAAGALAGACAQNLNPLLEPDWWEVWSSDGDEGSHFDVVHLGPQAIRRVHSEFGPADTGGPPGAARDAALSPDGRQLVWWYELDTRSIAVAVLDVVTGHLRRHPVSLEGAAPNSFEDLRLSFLASGVLALETKTHGFEGWPLPEAISLRAR